ncbi:copper-transporting ATPase 2 [Reticulomyxa filosa]|uniref:Copper-transporting ATPase 2 n=1 Tax=Reticulomyxa filosa TaxID=46433 RepID=X6NGU6_RETFI|nr:copper-transporting ATPase 2 [Reticulomyxa filosa]|eukprot:ETO25540.1 copper-transporting ATPase 2 [Reticulomyxa filosa]
MITGESIPRNVTIGDTVVSSAINCGDSIIYIRCDKLKSEGVLSQMIDLLKWSQLNKPSQQEFADQVSAWFVPVVVLISVCTFILWYSLCLAGVVPPHYYRPNSPVFFSLSFALAVLVIACPCALGLATPTAVMVGIGVASKYGLLVKGGDVLEVAHGLNTMVFDKTGTLTLGVPNVIETETGKKEDKEQQSVMTVGAMTKQDMVALAASAEINSEHPLAKAIVQYARTQFQLTDLSLPHSFVALPGKGVEAQVNGRNVKIGNWAFLFEKTEEDKLVEIALPDQFTDASQVADEMKTRALRGHITLLLAIDNVLCGMVCLFDAPRSEAKWVLEKLQQKNIATKMLTGDGKTTAHAVAKYIGLENAEDNVISQVLPQEKHAVIECLQKGIAWTKQTEKERQGNTKYIKKVAMIGDGVNDAAALAQADLGIAIGKGTDIAIEAAGVILMTDNLEHILTLLDLSKVIIHRIWWNFVWALGFNSLGIPIAAGIFYPVWKVRLAPEFAAIAMACSSLCVLASSLELKRYRSPFDKEKSQNKDKASLQKQSAKGCQCGLGCQCSKKKVNAYQELLPQIANTLTETSEIRCVCEHCNCYDIEEAVPLVQSK